MALADARNKGVGSSDVRALVATVAAWEKRVDRLFVGLERVVEGAAGGGANA